MDDKTVWEFGLTYYLNSCEPLPGVLWSTGTEGKTSKPQTWGTMTNIFAAQGNSAKVFRIKGI